MTDYTCTFTVSEVRCNKRTSLYTNISALTLAETSRSKPASEISSCISYCADEKDSFISLLKLSNTDRCQTPPVSQQSPCTYIRTSRPIPNIVNRNTFQPFYKSTRTLQSFAIAFMEHNDKDVDILNLCSGLINPHSSRHFRT